MRGMKHLGAPGGRPAVRGMKDLGSAMIKDLMGTLEGTIP